jgi:hypothetical protein
MLIQAFRTAAAVNLKRLAAALLATLFMTGRRVPGRANAVFPWAHILAIVL